jgi:hypothetical protein
MHSSVKPGDSPDQKSPPPQGAGDGGSTPDRDPPAATPDPAAPIVTFSAAPAAPPNVVHPAVPPPSPAPPRVAPAAPPRNERSSWEGAKHALSPSHLVAPRARRLVAVSSLIGFASVELHFFRDVVTGEVYGRAESLMSLVTGPAYFHAVAAGDGKTVELRFSELPPPAHVPSGWPPIAARGVDLSSPLLAQLVLLVRAADGGYLVASTRMARQDLGFFVFRDA